MIVDIHKKKVNKILNWEGKLEMRWIYFCEVGLILLVDFLSILCTISIHAIYHEKNQANSSKVKQNVHFKQIDL